MTDHHIDTRQTSVPATGRRLPRTMARTPKSAHVLSFPACPDTAAEWPEGFAAMRAHWDARRGAGGALPRRADIDPRGIAPLLHAAFVAERIAPGRARLRVAGRDMSGLMGMEVRGIPLSALFRPAAREPLASALVDLFDGPAALRLRLSAPRKLLHPRRQAAMLLLPLTSDLGDVSRLLGCLLIGASAAVAGAGHAGPWKPPMRFDIERVEVERLRPQRRPDRDGPPSPHRHHSAPDAAPSHRPARRPLRAERPWLRLVT